MRMNLCCSYFFNDFTSCDRAVGINVTKEPLCCTLCLPLRRRATAMGKRGNEEKREEKNFFFLVP